MFVTVIYKQYFKHNVHHTFIIYLHTKFYIPNSNRSLVITVKLKGKYRFCAAVMLMFYILTNFMEENPS